MILPALTIWQPWATLIMSGAKRFEFRRWDYRTRDRSLVGKRLAIHAGARKIRSIEIQDLIWRLTKNEGKGTALDITMALPIAESALTSPGRFPLAAVLGTAMLGPPRLASVLFKGDMADSDRIDQHMWAWPLTDVEVFEVPVPARGMQGFWRWHDQTNCAQLGPVAGGGCGVSGATMPKPPEPGTGDGGAATSAKGRSGGLETGSSAAEP